MGLKKGAPPKQEAQGDEQKPSGSTTAELSQEELAKERARQQDLQRDLNSQFGL